MMMQDKSVGGVKTISQPYPQQGYNTTSTQQMQPCKCSYGQL